MEFIEKLIPDNSIKQNKSSRNNFKIYNTKNSIYLQNLFTENLLEIVKENNEYKIVPNTIFSDLLIQDCISVHAFIGIINIFSYEFILYSSSSELVGKHLDTHDIFMIKQAEAFCLKDCKNEDIPKEIKTQLTGICSLLNLGYFYSFTYDLSSSFQRQELIKQNIFKDFTNFNSNFKENNDFNKKYMSNLNYNINFKLLHAFNSSQVKALVDKYYLDNIHRYANKKYFWNYRITDNFDNINRYYYFNKNNIINQINNDFDNIYLNDKQSSIQNNKFYLNNFIVVVICGYYTQSKIEKSLNFTQFPSNNSINLNISLISRRSINYSGTRYNRRGIDKDGYVANFVETEEILNIHDKIFSFVQLRGSAPVYFQQTGLNYKTTIISPANNSLSLSSFEKHINECLEDFNYMMIINLLDNNKDKEKEIINTFEELIQICTSNNVPSVKNTKYLYFNFHVECKNDDYSNIEKKLLSKIDKIFNIFGYFCFNTQDKSILFLQKGVFRTNCLDSLDRTNVVQTRICYEALRIQLNYIGINLKDITSFNNFSNESFFCSLQENDIIMQTFKDAWANNGDIISLQYAGTESNKTSITRSGKSEIIDNLKVGVNRFIQSNFEDKFKQSCYDVLQQIRIPSTINYAYSNNINNLSDTYTSKLNQKKEMIDNDDPSHLSIFTGTWNVAGNDLFKDTQLNLEDWLYPANSYYLNEIPDIYVVCFQEIVSLNAKYILFKSNTSTVDSWKVLVQDCLNNISRKYTKNYDSQSDEYILVKSLELVGILMVVFIKRKYFSDVKNIDFNIKKTGALGHLGNKGSVLYRFEYKNQSFAFSSGHFAAGQSALKNRIEELSDVLNLNINSNSTINSFKGRFQDHKFWFIIGDLNFRIDLENEQVRSQIKRNELNRLSSYDQLNKIKLEDKDFYCIDEGKIKFPPTYKYEIGTSEYEAKKNRVPSWCDRILFKKCDYIELLEYTSVQNICLSDHKPVFAVFKVNLKENNKISYNKQYSYTVNSQKQNQIRDVDIDKIKDMKRPSDNSNMKGNFQNNIVSQLNRLNIENQNKEKKKANKDVVELSLFKNVPDILTDINNKNENNISLFHNYYETPLPDMENKFPLSVNTVSDHLYLKKQIQSKPKSTDYNDDSNNQISHNLIDFSYNNQNQQTAKLTKKDTKDMLNEILNK